MSLNLQASYFSLKNPLDFFDRWLNPYHQRYDVDIRGKSVSINLTRRAENALAERTTPLVAELQLYFTCVVQKRVNFFDEKTEMTYPSGNQTIKVSPELELIYHTVQSNECDPTVFAETHPVKKELQSSGAMSMRPSSFDLDYHNGQWSGSFSI